MAEANPYQTPGADSEFPPLVRDRSAISRFAATYAFPLWLFVYLYPVWLLGSYYLTYLIGWIELGSPPRPMRDDPKSIGGMCSVAYYIPGVLLLLMPFLAPLGLFASWVHPIRTTSRKQAVWRLVFGVMYLLLFSFVIFLLRSDPGRVVEWWFD